MTGDGTTPTLLAQSSLPPSKRDRSEELPNLPVVSPALAGVLQVPLPNLQDSLVHMGSNSCWPRSNTNSGAGIA